MDVHQRKIELQSQADLTYLLENIRKCAQEKLDLAIPPSAAPQGEEDAYRTKVEALLQEVRFFPRFGRSSEADRLSMCDRHCP